MKFFRFDLRKHAHRQHLGVAAYVIFLVVFCVALIGVLLLLPDEWTYYPFLGIGGLFLLAWQFNRWRMRRGVASGTPWFMVKVLLCAGIDHYWDPEPAVDEQPLAALGVTGLTTQYRCRYCEVSRLDGVDADGAPFTMLRGHKYIVDGWQAGLTIQLGRYQRL